MRRRSKDSLYHPSTQRSSLPKVSLSTAIANTSFHRLLLLQRGGETVYFGDIGPDSAVLVDYLERNGAKVPANANPAEYVLEVIGAGSRKRIGGDWGETWRNSPELAAVKEEVHRLNAEAQAKPATSEKTATGTEYATTFWFQLKTVLNRSEWAV